jgi:hypothetical protein
VSRDVAPRLAALDAFVSGPAELWWPAGKGPLLRFPLKEGADAGAATAPLGSLARVADRALLLSEDPASLAETPKPDPGLDAVAAAAILRAPLPTLLAFFGRAGAASDRETVWRVLAGDGDIVVTSGRLEPGPVTVLAASLLR